MAINLLALPQVQAPRSLLLDLAPINQALDYQQALKQQAFQNSRAMAQDRRAAAAEDREARFAPLRQAQAQAAIDASRGSETRAQAMHPLDMRAKQASIAATSAQLAQAKALTPDGRAAIAQRFGIDVNTPEGRGFVLSGTYTPRTDKYVQFDPEKGPVYKQGADGSVAPANLPGMAGGGGALTARAEQAAAIGLKPGTAEYDFYMANKKLPNGYFDKVEAERRRTESGTKIASGLNNLLKMTDRFDDASFTNALGPLQGAEPGSMLSGIGANAARLGGEVVNWFQGGKTSPTEVRSGIGGDVEALAAAIKPLIRGPGEGPWTDADQARLVAVVGDLATAGTKDEFRRRLNSVRDRVQSNFGMKIPFEAIPQQNQGMPRAIPRVTGAADYGALPSGARYIDPNGNVRQKP